MKHLPTITRLAIPAAMASFLTIEITKSQQVTGWLVYLVTFAAFFTSLGIELWGIIAGDNLDKSWKLDHGRSWAVVQMIVYVLVGAWLLRHNTTIIMLPLVAALAYVASGFADSLDTAVQSKEQETAVAREFGREQEAADREHKRRLEIRQQEIDAKTNLELQIVHQRAQADIAMQAEKTKATIANAEARKAKAQTKTGESTSNYPKVSPKDDSLSGSALSVFNALLENPDATNVEIAESLPITPQRVGQIKRQLNGRVKAAIGG